MTTERNALSPRADDNNLWVPSFFTCGEGITPPANRTTKSAPILILKGLGTMTLGRLGEGQNILRDDIVTWKKRIEDSLYIGWITYTTSSTTKEIFDPTDDAVEVSKGFGPPLVVIDNIDEHCLRKVEGRLAAEKGLTKNLTQLLKVLLVRCRSYLPPLCFYEISLNWILQVES